MSAALVDSLVTVDVDDPPVADWLADLPSESGRGVRTSSKPQLSLVCAAAVDPLEIAANLEAAGMTNALVRETSPHFDVFGLARQLWVDVGYEPVDVAPQDGLRSGNWRDLARGVLYAAPALLMYSLMHALHVEVAWWTLPLGVTWGWALGQVIAFTGFALRGRGLKDAAARCGGWLLLWATALNRHSRRGGQRRVRRRDHLRRGGDHAHDLHGGRRHPAAPQEGAAGRLAPCPGRPGHGRRPGGGKQRRDRRVRCRRRTRDGGGHHDRCGDAPAGSAFEVVSGSDRPTSQWHSPISSMVCCAAWPCRWSPSRAHV